MIKGLRVLSLYELPSHSHPALYLSSKTNAKKSNFRHMLGLVCISVNLVSSNSIVAAYVWPRIQPKGQTISEPDRDTRSGPFFKWNIFVSEKPD